MERYTKKFRFGLWSIPIFRASLPPDANILPAVSTFNIKNTEVDDFYFRLCANGSKMRQGVDYDQDHSPTGTHKSIWRKLALSAG